MNTLKPRRSLDPILGDRIARAALCLYSRRWLSSQHVSPSRASYKPTTRSAGATSLQFPSQSRSHSGCACHGGKRPKTAYVAFGSNLGDRVAEIERACNLMEERGIHVKRTSSLWETEPMYVKDQGQFVNGVCEVSARMIMIRPSMPATNLGRDICA
jgi:hypothetical protein